MRSDDSADTLSEYDVIIFSFESTSGYSSERYQQLESFLSRKNKLFIFILNRKVEFLNTSNTIIIEELLMRLRKKQHPVINSVSSGSQFILQKNSPNNLMYEYLNMDDKPWKISFLDYNDEFMIPVAKNTDGNIVAFSITSETVKAVNAFVPWLPNNEEKFWGTIKNYLLNKNTDFTEVAEWVNDYKFPQLVAIDDQIKEKELLVSKIVREKEQLEIQKQNYERIRNTLLYFDGDLLQEVCKEVLQFLGIAVENGKQGREDLVFIHEGDHFLIEVKGCEKSANKGHVKQVSSHVTEYRHENEVEVKGILLINAWRKLSLEERDTKDKPIFPNEIMKLVELSKITLLTTQQLFIAYCDQLNGEFNFVSFIGELSERVGKFIDYDGLSKYRVSNT